MASLLLVLYTPNITDEPLPPLLLPQPIDKAIFGFDFSEEKEAFDFNSLSQSSDTDCTMELIETALRDEDSSPFSLADHININWAKPVAHEAFRMKSAIFGFGNRWFPVWYRERVIGELSFVLQRAAKFERLLQQHIYRPSRAIKRSCAPTMVVQGIRCIKALAMMSRILIRQQQEEAMFLKTRLLVELKETHEEDQQADEKTQRALAHRIFLARRELDECCDKFSKVLEPAFNACLRIGEDECEMLTEHADKAITEMWEELREEVEMVDEADASLKYTFSLPLQEQKTRLEAWSELEKSQIQVP